MGAAGTRAGRERGRRDLLGESFASLCGGALAINLLLVVGLLLLLVVHGGAAFWPKRLLAVTLEDGTRLLAEVWERRELSHRGPEPTRPGRQLRLKIGNRDLGGADFRWVDEADMVERRYPPGAVVLERLEWGNFHGYLVELRRGAEVLASGHEAVLRAFGSLHRSALERRRELARLERTELGRINRALERLRREERRLGLGALPAAERLRRAGQIARSRGHLEERHVELEKKIAELGGALAENVLVARAPGGQTREIPLSAIVRLVAPNTLGLAGRARLYLSRAAEFVTGEPRESNTEGGIFPALFGTALMVLLMTCVATPLGVLAAVYLHEYARRGPLLRAVRIAVHNLAGVPSIVFGIFGLGFFVYLVGGAMDRLLFADRLPSPTFGTGGLLWASLTLALLTVPVVIVATEEGLAAVPRSLREASLALGATKAETILRVVLPAAAPGALTGMILAMARAAGEVAPLMVVGMVKLAPALPVDSRFPFVHLERKFMHLGFHVYDVGFQSPNVEATKPIVFATALLLVVLVTALNLVAIVARNRLRRKLAPAVF